MMKPLSQLEQCFKSANPIPPDTLIELFDQCNKSTTQEKEYTDQQIIDIIVMGTTSIPMQNKASSPFCHFIFKQCTKQIRLSSFRASSFEKCLTYLLDGLDSSQVTAESRVDILRALSALLYENSTNTSKFYARLAPLLLKNAERSVKPLEIRRMAINCVGNLCAGAGSKLQSYYKDIYQVLLSNLCVVSQTSKGTIMVASSTSLDFTDPAVRKVASSTLRALQFLLSQDRMLITDPLCDIVDIIHTFLFMHVNVQSYQHLYAMASTSSSSSKDIAIKTGSRLHGLSRSPRSSITQPYYQQLSWRSPNLKYLSNGIISSDSEMSDSDGMAFNPRKFRDDAKIRINAVLCLLSIAKTQPKTLYPHWQKFIPDSFSVFLKNHVLASHTTTTTLATTTSSSTIYPLSPILRSDHQPYSLITLLIYDPMVTVRVAVCHTLIAMLDGSKQYLSMASERDTKSSFTSLSERLASVLHDLHLGLVYALSRESDVEVLGLIMKVMSTVMANTSYDRLSSGYLTQFYHAILSHWNSNNGGMKRMDDEGRNTSVDTQEESSSSQQQQQQKNDTEVVDDKQKQGEDLQVTILQTLAILVTATGAATEIQALMMTMPTTKRNSVTICETGLVGGDKSNTDHLPLLPLLLSLVDNNNNKLDGAVGRALNVQVESWHVLSVCAKYHFDSVIFNAWCQIETPFDTAFSQQKLRTASLEFIEAYASSMIPFCMDEARVDSEDLQKCIKWWMVILEKYIQQASMEPISAVRVLTCDCLSSMAKAVFERLPTRYQRLAMALLLPLPEDEESQVRAAACRALGAFVLFPSLREDTCFVSDMATAILDRMKDTVTLVRLRASWAQGNLCDALVIASDADDFNLREWISIPTWMTILSTATSASLDNDKLRSNAVRAMGSLLRITPLDYFQDRHGMLLLRDAMVGLVKNIESGSLKTRWNACHAASNVLKNDVFPMGFIQQDQQQQSDYDENGERYGKQQRQQQEYPWTSTIYQALIHAMTKCKNYKVRINACLALATPHHQSLYGHHLQAIFQAILDTWYTCHDPNVTADFQEYKYQEQLNDQIKAALLHIRGWLPGQDQLTIDTLFLDT